MTSASSRQIQAERYFSDVLSIHLELTLIYCALCCQESKPIMPLLVGPGWVILRKRPGFSDQRGARVFCGKYRFLEKIAVLGQKGVVLLETSAVTV